MQIDTLAIGFSVSGQLEPGDVERVSELGFKTLINNRPDDEAADQPTSDELKVLAESAGIDYHHLPIEAGPQPIPVATVNQFDAIMADAKKPVLAFCRTGNRSTKLWERRSDISTKNSSGQAGRHVQVLIIGGGAGGLATAASLRKRDSDLDIAVVEPRDTHYYQPGWTLVGAGVFRPEATLRPMQSLIPKGVSWISDAVAGFEPQRNVVRLASGAELTYECLVVAAGIKLDWDKVDGLRESLGKHGVTSNYDINFAPGTWQLVKGLKAGRAVFTQPPMPIKCAGAPQKALYLSADYWQRQGTLKDIDIDFYNAGGVLFGVPDYVPALEAYIRKYDANVHFNHNLVAVDGPGGKARFAGSDGSDVEVEFDFLHVSPPQCAPDFIRESGLANEAGWVDVDQTTLRHVRYPNVYSLGDVCSTPNAKTAAAVRKQAPVVAHNILAMLSNENTVAQYDGYGSCPLTVERGRVVLAEFGYGGKLLPSVPAWLLNGKSATRAGWLLKAHLLKPIYYDLMLKGHEWLAAPEILARSGDESTPVAGSQT